VSSKPSPSGLAPASPSGFSAQLRGASLFDLIQFECASRGRKVVRVTSDARSALLYFSDGRIVHAAAGRITGEEAVREVLTWGQGTFARFDHFDGAWPRLETITASAESVLLRAAQCLDEGAGNVVALPVREPPAPPPLPKPRVPPRRPMVELTLRLSPDGDLLERQGYADDQDGFCDAVAYAAQLTDLIGGLLGLADFTNVELNFRDSRCVLARQHDGTLLATKGGPQTHLDDLRQKLGL
jgi:hypothetical protein